jgi:hypothetical protein
MAFLRSDLRNMLVAEIQSRPAAAAAYRAGDPRLLAQAETFAAMLAAISAQIDVAEVEPFLKARAGTILADAALKGMLPMGRNARVQIRVQNNSNAPVLMSVGRGLVDGKGRLYSVDGSASIAAGAAGLVTATQATIRQVTHTVSGAKPFYEVLIPGNEEDAHLAGLEVSDQVGSFRFSDEFTNVGVDERVYHVETDEFRRIWLRFGANDGVAIRHGHQPADGDILTITLYECAGKIELFQGDTFSIETIATLAESETVLTLDQVLSPGASPPSFETLRMLARYPGMHDSNAVFLNDFDFLLRKRLDGFEFLSVWNEQAEEAVRGASVNNVNVLFVSFSAPAYSVPVMQSRITGVVGKADDSYRVRFVPAVESAISITVNARVASVHDTGAVAAQIRTTLLTLYGKGSPAASLGLSRTFRAQDVNARLRESVPALQDQVGDFNVQVGASAAPKPEDFRYATAGSVVVNVTQMTDTLGLFSA